ncbi:hypothetical protein [Faecalibacterium prausnitzii]|uniref:Uncharacterized protein n=1 Tax=Faecalibacterium prausnitzii TaxID=853 RepID=A0A329UA39_9FIRM|nr:hypothetical protein [Faecalibacterium prausnitzii]RAW58295.1 hypothetical protein C4N22_10135 [Faecalibacterium prausnitzii]
MRKNLAKHTAKRLPLAKRVLALCFALIFVCSCLLPAFANGTGAELETPGTEVVEAAAPGAEPEPMDLYDEPAAVADEPEALDDNFGVADEPAAMDNEVEKPVVDDEPAAMDDQVEKPVVDDEPAAMDDQVEKPVVDDEPAAMDNEVEKPVEGGEPPVADDTPAEEGATKTTTDASGNIVYEYDTSGTTFPDDDAAALPDGDQVLDQMDAAFSIPTNIYHFWLKKMSSYDLEDIARDAETAEMTVEQYLAMYGTEKGCYHIMTAADGANLKDYQFANPTSNDDPEGNSRTFAGWYYTDDLGDEQKFVFDECLYVSEGTTVEVYAKWKKPEATKSVTLDGQTISFKVEGATTLNVEALDTDTQKNLEDELIQKIDPKEYNALYTFNISPKDEGGLELEQTSKVTISGLDLTSAADVKVFHQGADLEELKVNVTSDGDLTFTTNGFSPFAILVADLSKANDSDSSDADDRMAELANEDKAYTVYSDGSNIEMPLNGTYTLSGNAYKPYWYTNYHSWSIESGDDVVSFTSEKNIQNPTIKGKSVGTAKLKHTYYIYYYNQKYSYDEEFTINVTKFEDTYSGSAYIYFLKLPTGDPMNNDTGEWAPKADKSKLEAKISTAGATWTNGYTNDNSAIPNKNIVTGNGQILTDYITSWPDGSTGTTWTVKKDDPTTGSYFTSIWNEISENYIASIQNETGINDLTVDDITEIILTPRKISRNNGGSQNYHIDCAISVVTKKVFTAKFMVKDPTKGEEKWSQVDSKNYKEGEAVIKTTAVTIGTTKTVEGVRYELKGWYTEDPLGDINVHGPLIEDNEWRKRGTNDYGYLTTSTDAVREDGTVYFYAVWEPETQKPIRTITKKVEGLFGDRSKQFRIVVTGPNGFSQEFTLAHGETGTLNNLMVQVGDVITITEYDASDYDTTAQIYYSNSSNGLLGANGQEFTGENEKTTTITITDDMIDLDEINITVTNEKDAPVDNGVLLDTLPYILILVVVAGGGVLLFLRKRKNDDDE